MELILVYERIFSFYSLTSSQKSGFLTDFKGKRRNRVPLTPLNANRGTFLFVSQRPRLLDHLIIRSQTVPVEIYGATELACLVRGKVVITNITFG